MIPTGQGCCVSEAGQAGGAQSQVGGGGGEAGVQVSMGTCSEYRASSQMLSYLTS